MNKKRVVVLFFAIFTLNSTYFIDNIPVTLVNGIEIKEIAPGSASNKITKYLGYELDVDLNSDGIEDYIFFLTQDFGGSGTFYYVVVSFGSKDGFTGSNGIFIGDRITPLNITFEDKQICIYYLVRKESEPMVAKPTIEKMKLLKIENNNLVEI